MSAVSWSQCAFHSYKCQYKEMQILHLYYKARLVSKKIAKVVTKQMDDNVQNAIALFKNGLLGSIFKCSSLHKVQKFQAIKSWNKSCQGSAIHPVKIGAAHFEGSSLKAKQPPLETLSILIRGKTSNSLCLYHFQTDPLVPNW